MSEAGRYLRYAWHGYANEWWLPILGALLIWLGLKMSGLDLPFHEGLIGFVEQALSFVIIAWIFIFLIRFAWAPVHLHFEKRGYPTLWKPLMAAFLLGIGIGVGGTLLFNVSASSARIRIAEIIYGGNPAAVPKEEIAEQCNGLQACIYSYSDTKWKSKYSDPLKGAYKDVEVFFNCGGASTTSYTKCEKVKEAKIHFSCENKKPIAWCD
jgi:hypothetical protein